MHCWKTLNIQYEYGTARLYLLMSILFVLIFSFSYVAFSFQHLEKHDDHFLLLFLIALPFVYPIHKLIHFILLFDYRKNIVFRLKKQFGHALVIHMRLQQYIPKNRYIIALLGPFVILNGGFIFGGFLYPQYAHYYSLLLAFHCALCLIDILYAKHLVAAPKNAIIEETPKGYEILVPSI